MVTDVMGILNVTPDSFSDGGALVNEEIKKNSGIFKLDMDKVLRKVDNMIKDGATIIDIGGESTRPGFEVVSIQEEIDRVIPVVEKIKSEFNIAISLDTYKAKTALEGIKAGIDIVNDIGMLAMDEGMIDVISENDIKYVLTHNKANYINQIEDMNYEIERMLSKGVKKDNIILDPGIGFNKSYEQNVSEIKNIDKLCALDYPVLLGVSNKSVIGNALNLPIGERLEGTLALSVMAVMYGVKIIRVHDVKSNVRAIKMAETILGY